MVRRTDKSAGDFGLHWSKLTREFEQQDIWNRGAFAERGLHTRNFSLLLALGNNILAVPHADRRIVA